MNEMEASSQIKPESYADGKSTSRSFSITRHPRTLQVGPPTLDEVCTAIRQLRNNRAPGEDGIPAEVYKTCLSPWAHGYI